MISKLLNTILRGFQVMRSNTKLLFVGVLVFVFPLLFIVLVEGFFESARGAVESAELKRVGTLHDVAAIYIVASDKSESSFAALSSEIVKQNPDITEVRIVERTNEGLLIRESLEKEKIGTYEEKTFLYDSVAFAEKEKPFTFPFTQNEVRMWQTVRAVHLSDGLQYYILTEQSFKKTDDLLQARLQQSYMGLTAIFVFLIVLAYWVARQTDWQRKHGAIQAQLVERDLFTNMIAHEFRAPLTVVSGYVSFLKESKSLHPAEMRFVSNIDASTTRLLALVNDFLEVARIQSGKMDFLMEEVDLSAALNEVVENNQLTASKKNLTLSFSKNNTPLLHKTDAKRFGQILQNMITNAIKYTEKGGVEIVAEQNPLFTIIRIKDTGMGIDAADQQKLFAPFARVGGVEKTNITGTGLGMWITKQMISLLNGTISIESIKGVGTHVVISLKR
jgi:signal transduction histidine kinase